MVSRTKLVVILGSVVLLTALLALGLASVSAAPGVNLAISKWSEPWAPGPVIAGEEFFYHISVRNNGDITATGVVVADDFYSPVVYIDDTGGCTFDGVELTCRLGSLEAGAYRDFEIKVYVPADAVDWTNDGTITIDNTAVVGSNEVDDDPSDNLVTLSMFVEDLADLSVTKMSKPDLRVQAGDTFVYTIIVENLGPSFSRGVALIDNIVSSGYFTILDWNMNRDGSCDVQPYPEGVGQVLYCKFYGGEGYPDALEPKGFFWYDDELREWLGGGQWIIQVAVQANETQDVDNVVNVFTQDLPDRDFLGTEDPNLFNNTAEDFISVEDVADLSIDKYLVACDGPYGRCVAGAGATFGITVTNNGPSLAENVVVEDPLPSGVTLFDVYGAGGCTTGIPGDPFVPLTCNLGNIPPRESRSLTIVLRIDPDYPLIGGYGQFVGVLENDAWVYSDIFDPDNSNNRDHEILYPQAFSWLVPDKFCPESVLAGEEFDYLIPIENHGPSTVYNLFISDTLHEGLTFVDYEIVMGDGTCLYNADQHTVACSLGDVDPGERTVVKLTVRVRPDYEGTLVYNDLTDGVWADSPLQEFQEWPICETRVQLLTDLSIQKTSEPPKIFPGEQKVYHIEVTNHGPADAPDVMVTDTLPAEVTYQIDTDNCDLVGGPDVLSCNLGTIPAGQTVQFDIHALVEPDYPITQTVEITNIAEVWMNTRAVTDTNAENNAASVTNLILVPTVANLGLTKTASPGPWYAGGNMTYTLTVSNTGPLVAQNVVLEDLLPAELTVLGVSADQGSCTTGTPGAVPLVCNLGNLQVDQEVSVQVEVFIDPSYWGPLENDASVSSDTPDQDEGNNLANLIIMVEPESELWVEKKGPEDIPSGQVIDYNIDVANYGPSTAHEVHVNDKLPDEVALLGAQIVIGDGSCVEGTGICSLGDVAPYEWHSIHVWGLVQPWVEDLKVITNTAEVWAESPFTGTVTSEVTTTVHSQADLAIWKTSDPYKVYAGEQKRYDITVVNNGPSVARNVVVADTLPSGVEFELSTINCPATMLGSTQPRWWIDEGGDLFGVDLGTGAGSFIGQMPEWLAAEIEYDNTTGRLFASMGFRPWYDSDYEPLLYELDPLTGAEIMSVTLSQPCALPGLEFVGDTLYGTCSNAPGGDPHLVTVDPDTGAVTNVGGSMYIYDLIHGLAYDESSGIMYGLQAGEYSDNELWEINLGTGQANWLCDLWDADFGGDVDALRSIEFGPDGVLYGGVATDSDLVRIDTTPYGGDDRDPYCDVHHIGDTGFSVSGLTLMGGQTLCPLGDIPPGETRNFSIFVQVKPDTLGIINNRVEVSSDNDPNPGNNWDTEANLVMGKADLRVRKYGPAGPVEAPGPLIYTIVVDNLGPGYAHDVELRDLFTSTSLDYDIGPVWSEAPGPPPPPCMVQEWGRQARITCNLPQMEVYSPDTSGRWVVRVYVEVEEDQNITNVVDVVSDDDDPDLSNNHDEANNDVEPVTDLQVTKFAWGEIPDDCEQPPYPTQPGRVAAGASLRYDLMVCNVGPSRAENVVLEDWGISPLLDITDVSWDPGVTCLKGELGQQGDTNRRLTCYLGYVPGPFPWFCKSIHIEADVPSDVPEGTILLNEAKVYGDLYDERNWNNFATNDTTVEVWADLGVEKSQEPEVVFPGQDITYSITVTNEGPSDALGAIISDTIPPEVLNPTWSCCCSSDGSECDVPCEVPVCPAGECPWPDIGLYAQADIPADAYAIYTVEGVLDVWPCELPITNTVEVIAPESLLYAPEDIDFCDENNDDTAINKVPFCYYDPLLLKNFSRPDSPL